MPTQEITSTNFRETVERDGIVLLDWWAEWCGPCKRFGPIFEQSAEKHPDITFGKVDTEAQQELAGAFQIMSIPMLMVFRDRVLVYSQPGALPAEALEEIIAKVKSLDMDQVRAEVAAHQATHGDGAQGAEEPS